MRGGRAVATSGRTEVEGSLRYYDTDFANPHARPLAAADAGHVSITPLRLARLGTGGDDGETPESTGARLDGRVDHVVGDDVRGLPEPPHRQQDRCYDDQPRCRGVGHDPRNSIARRQTGRHADRRRRDLCGQRFLRGLLHGDR